MPGALALAAAIAALALAARRTIRGRHDAASRADGAVAAAGLVSFGALAIAFFPFRVALTGYQAVLFFAWLIATAAATVDAGELASAAAPRREGAWPCRGNLARAAAVSPARSSPRRCSRSSCCTLAAPSIA